jgi:NADPH:quinone reductase-like Zn-dependent oxidoreductase
MAQRRTAGVRRRSDDLERTAEFLGEELMEDLLSEGEQRAILQQAGEDAAAIVIDLETGGLLSQVLADLRPVARTAYGVLAQTSPTDTATIAAAQVEVRAYEMVRDFVINRLLKAHTAEQIIDEQYQQKDGHTHATHDHE